jgi:hypothetical protein
VRTISVTFEDGTWVAWLYDLLKPHVAHVLACKSARTQRSTKATGVTRSKPTNSPTGYGSMISSRSTTCENGIRVLRELARSYLTIALWWRTLRRRSQKHRISWTRTLALAQRWLPQPSTLHPFADARFATTHLR